jgi:putative Holliday junction resolvase
VERGRRIAFDYGDSRIGVAVCDPDGILATPLPFLDARHPKLLRHIALLIEEYSPIHIYIGEPRNLSGEGSNSSEKARGFGEQLHTEFKLPISYIDERLTTVDAARKLRDSGINAKAAKNLIDSMSAVVILESGLSHEAR